jgi:hypothetical protein
MSLSLLLLVARGTAVPLAALAGLLVLCSATVTGMISARGTDADVSGGRLPPRPPDPSGPRKNRRVANALLRASALP